jgi:hypothetical protein
MGGNFGVSELLMPYARLGGRRSDLRFILNVPVSERRFSMDVFQNENGDRSGGVTALNDCGRGQAALLLIESLMHALVSKGALSREEFIEVVEGAAEVELELMNAEACSPPDGRGSFLYPLANAFGRELGK